MSFPTLEASPNGLQPRQPRVDLRMLDGPDWVAGQERPLLDEHRLVDPDRGTSVDVDGQFLEDVARNANRRAAEKGNPVPIIIGHTEDGGEERPVQGYYVNFRVVTDLSDPARSKKVLVATPRVRRNNRDLLDKFPRPSVELWVSKREIDPVAHLGGTTPQRDLGDTAVLRYQRGGQLVLRYLRECDLPEQTPMNMPNKKYAADTGDAPPSGGSDSGGGGDDALVAKVFESAQMKALMAKIDKISAALGEGEDDVPADLEGQGGQFGDNDFDLEPPGDMGGPMGGGMPPGGAGGPPMMGGPPPGGGPMEGEARHLHSPPPVQFNMGGGYPSATSGFTPGEPSRMSRANQPQQLFYFDPSYGDFFPYQPQPAPQPQRQTPAGMTKEQAARLSRLEQENARLHAEKLMGHLAEQEGIIFGNPEKTLGHFVTLMVEGGQKAVEEYVGEIKANYARREMAPTTPAEVFRYQRDPGPAQDGPGPKTMHDVMRAVNQARPGERSADLYARLFSPNGNGQQQRR